MREDFDFHSLKQFILGNYLNFMQNKTSAMDDVTKELLRLGEVFNSNAPRHLVGLMYYYGIGVIADKNAAIGHFREIANDSALCETLVWLTIIYLQNNPKEELVPRAKTAQGYYCKLKAAYNDKIPKYYLPYHKLADIIALYNAENGNKKQALKDYYKLCNADYSSNLEMKLLLKEFREILDTDKEKIEDKDKTDRKSASENIHKETVSSENGLSIFTYKGRKLKNTNKTHSIFEPYKSHNKKY